MAHGCRGQGLGVEGGYRLRARVQEIREPDIGHSEVLPNEVRGLELGWRGHGVRVGD